MSDFNVKLTVRSGRIISAIEEKFGSQAKMSRATGMSIQQISSFVCMRQKPVGEKGWTRFAEDFATALGVYPSDIWPDHMREVTMKRATAQVSLDADQVQQIINHGGDTEQKLLLGAATEGMNQRHLLALDMFKDGATLAEIGEELGVSGPRARQILATGMSHVRKKMERMGITRMADVLQ